MIKQTLNLALFRLKVRNCSCTETTETTFSGLWMFCDDLFRGVPFSDLVEGQKFIFDYLRVSVSTGGKSSL